MHTKNLCPKCGIPLEGTTCPVCGQRLGGKEFIPLESSGFSRRNLRLLGLLGGVVVLLGVCAMVLFAVGEQQQTTQVSSSFEESSESSVSEPELPVHCWMNKQQFPGSQMKNRYLQSTVVVGKDTGFTYWTIK